MPALGERRNRRDGKAYAEWNGQVWVEHPMAGQSGGVPKLSAQDSKALAEQRTAAQNIRGARKQAYEFVQRNADTPTGGFMAIPGFSEVAGAFKPEVSTLQGLSNDMIPGMHVTPGPMTDADAKLYRSAIPNPNLPFQTNRNLARNISRKEREVGARSAFFEAYAARKGSLNGAEAAFNKWYGDYTRQQGNPFAQFDRPKSPGEMSDDELLAALGG